MEPAKQADEYKWSGESGSLFSLCKSKKHEAARKLLNSPQMCLCYSLIVFFRFILLRVARGTSCTLLRFQRRLQQRSLKKIHVPTLERCRNFARSWGDLRPRACLRTMWYCDMQYSYCTAHLCELLLYTKATRKHTSTSMCIWWIALRTRCGRS